MPNVPRLPGVPPLSSYSANAVTLLVRDAIDFFFGRAHTLWGLFLNGVPVVIADSVVSFDFKRDWSIADYQIEQGGFESYDKVALPAEIRLRFSSGGDQEGRDALLDSVESVAGSLDLFDAATPDRIYQNLNPQRYDYRRTAGSGANMIVIDLFCQEARVGTNSKFSSTKDPASASPASGGTVQPVPFLSLQRQLPSFT